MIDDLDSFINDFSSPDTDFDISKIDMSDFEYQETIEELYEAGIVLLHYYSLILENLNKTKGRLDYSYHFDKTLHTCSKLFIKVLQFQGHDTTLISLNIARETLKDLVIKGKYNESISLPLLMDFK